MSYGDLFYGEGLYYGPNNVGPSTLSFWCPPSASDPESSDLGDLGGFEEPLTPAFTSQKNIVDVAFDPRTGKQIRTQGGFGSFGESPPTDMQISTSADCGRTWTTPVNFATYIEGSYTAPPFSVLGMPTYFQTPVSVIPGANEGEWLLFDFVGGYYLSTDDGLTWGPRQYSAILPSSPPSSGLYYGLVGVDGQFNTRAITPHHYLEVGQIGYGFMLTVPFRAGIRRSLGPNGSLGWDNSLEPTDFASGGCGWNAEITPPLLHGANGRWIAAVGYDGSQGFDDDTFALEVVPPMRINTSSNLNPASWGAPFWPISEAFYTDIYSGFKTGGSYGVAALQFEYGHGRLKFIPQTSHPVGGRWWFMGMQDCILYSDDNGVTWSNSLADHAGPESEMHPILNWRASHALGYRYTPSKIMDIVTDQVGSGRIMAIGVTYDRPGITNRLAVFCCSVDGGDTWGPVGQLPLRLSNITSSGTNPDFDSPATVRHGFPCVG